jgi:hypothetical protein
LTFRDLPRPSSFDEIISILSGVTHLTLETVTITIFVDYIMEKTGALEQLSASLSALDSLFMNGPLSNNLTKLCFEFLIELVEGNGLEEEVRSAVKDGLPKLDGKKRLKFGV